MRLSEKNNYHLETYDKKQMNPFSYPKSKRQRIDHRHPLSFIVMLCFLGYIKVDGVSSVFCFIWGWEEPAWGLPFQFHGVFYVMISMKGP